MHNSLFYYLGGFITVAAMVFLSRTFRRGHRAAIIQPGETFKEISNISDLNISFIKLIS